MDFVTDLPLVEVSNSYSTMKYNAIFTMVDRLTKFVRLVLYYLGESHMSIQETVWLLFDHFVRYFGVPSSVVHDHNPQFKAAFWQELWQILGCKVQASSSHHPQMDGQTERAHRTLEQIMRSYVLEANSEPV